MTKSEQERTRFSFMSKDLTIGSPDEDFSSRVGRYYQQIQESQSDAEESNRKYGKDNVSRWIAGKAFGLAALERDVTKLVPNLTPSEEVKVRCEYDQEKDEWAAVVVVQGQDRKPYVVRGENDAPYIIQGKDSEFYTVHGDIAETFAKETGNYMMLHDYLHLKQHGETPREQLEVKETEDLFDRCAKDFIPISEIRGLELDGTSTTTPEVEQLSFAPHVLDIGRRDDSLESRTARYQERYADSSYLQQQDDLGAGFISKCAAVEEALFESCSALEEDKRTVLHETYHAGEHPRWDVVVQQEGADPITMSGEEALAIIEASGENQSIVDAYLSSNPASALHEVYGGYFQECQDRYDAIGTDDFNVLAAWANEGLAIDDGAI